MKSTAHGVEMEKDKVLVEAKKDVQEPSWRLLRSGERKQSDFFLVRPELARAAVFKLKR